MEKMTGKLIWLSVNEGTEEVPVWAKFACTTSDGFSGSTEEVSIATKCDDGATSSAPTNTSWEFNCSAVAVSGIEAGLAGYQTAAEIWKTRAVKQFKMANADESYYRMGKGFINSISDTAEEAGFLTYEFTVKGTGEVELEAPAAV